MAWRCMSHNKGHILYVQNVHDISSAGLWGPSRISIGDLPALLTHQENRSIMCSNLGRNTLLLTSHILTTPHIHNIVATSFHQLRDLSVVRCHLHRAVRRVEHRHHSPVARSARPVHSRVRAIERPVRVDTPLVRLRGQSHDRVLVEG